MLKNIMAAFTLVVVTLLHTGCGTKEIAIAPSLQGKLYTQANMWEEKSRVYSTNYSRGMIIPVNSEITIDSMTNKAIVFTVKKTSQQVTLLNVEKHTQLSSEDLAKQIFASKPVSVKSFSKTAQDAINYGEVKAGMTKKEVLASRGFPPAILTNSLDQNSWMYQQHRFKKMRIDFENGKVAKVVH